MTFPNPPPLTLAAALALFQPLNATLTTLSGKAFTGSGDIVLATTPTLVTPTVASFVNATHSHQNAAGGGTLDAAAIGSGTFDNARVNWAAPGTIGSGTPSTGAFTGLTSPTLRGGTVANTVLTVRGNTASSGNTGTVSSVDIVVGNAGGISSSFRNDGKIVLGLLEGVGIGAAAGGNTFDSYKQFRVGPSVGVFNFDVTTAGLTTIKGQVNLPTPSNDPGLIFLGDGNAAHDTKYAITVQNSGSNNVFRVRRDGLSTNTVFDAATNTVTNVLTLGHNTSGTPAASYGTGQLFQGQSSTTTNRDMARIRSLWATATDASRVASMVLSVWNVGTETDVLTLTPTQITASVLTFAISTAGNSKLFVDTSAASDTQLGFRRVGTAEWHMGRRNSDGAFAIGQSSSLASSSAFGFSTTNVVFVANGTAPSGTPTGGGYLYVESGALWFKGSGGTSTKIANA